MHNEIVSDYGRGCHEQKIEGRFRKALYMIETCSSSIKHTSAQVYELVPDILIIKGPRSTGVSVEGLLVCKNLIPAHTSDSTGSHSSSSIICLCSHRHFCNSTT